MHFYEFILLVRCQFGHVILHPSSLIVFPSSHCLVSFFPLAFQLDYLAFPKRKKTLRKVLLEKA